VTLVISIGKMIQTSMFRHPDRRTGRAELVTLIGCVEVSVRDLTKEIRPPNAIRHGEETVDPKRKEPPVTLTLD